MGLPIIEEQNTSGYCLSPKIYQPPAEAMDGWFESPRKKKMFSSSSFYEEPKCIYPTVEEQVKLCRKIAESLSDDCNLKSKGANMFFKRVKKAEKWIVAESNATNDEERPSANQDPAQLPYVRPGKNLPKLKLVLAPRQIVDMRRLIEEGVDIVEHNAVSPDVCHDIVKDLNSPTGKGAQLYAKRKKKSSEWIVDEDKVKHVFEERYQMSYPAQESHPEPVMHPRVKALSEVTSQKVVESVIRAAEAKIMTYPNAVPHVPVIQSLDSVDGKTGSLSSDLLKFSFPKGWTSSLAPNSLDRFNSPALAPLNIECPQAPVKHSLERGSSLSRTLSFRNFNTSPRSWNADVPNQFRPACIKPVKPPSVLVQ